MSDESKRKLIALGLEKPAGRVDRITELAAAITALQSEKISGFEISCRTQQDVDFYLDILSRYEFPVTQDGFTLRVVRPPTSTV